MRQMKPCVGGGRMSSQSPNKRTSLLSGGLVATTFRGINECILIVSMCVILCPTPRIERAGGGQDQY